MRNPINKVKFIITDQFTIETDPLSGENTNFKTLIIFPIGVVGRLKSSDSHEKIET